MNRLDLINKLTRRGFEGPFRVGNHDFMRRNKWVKVKKRDLDQPDVLEEEFMRDAKELEDIYIKDRVCVKIPQKEISEHYLAKIMIHAEVDRESWTQF